MNEEKKGLEQSAEVESLNEKVLNADEASLDDLEEVSGGQGGGTGDPACGTLIIRCTTYS